MNRKGCSGGFWLIVIILLLALVVMAGLIYDSSKHQELLSAPYQQEAFTLPVTDKDAPEMAVVGPESEVDDGR